MAMYATHDTEGILFAFWDGESKGTEHMIDIAETHTFQQSSEWGIFEGTVTIIETKE